MSNYNDRDSSSEKITVAGIAAVIVVAVFVICVILILAKSLFPSNTDSTPEGVYTGTKSSQTDAPESKADSSVAEVVDSIIDESQAEFDSETDTDSATDSDTETTSVADGETAYLTQTAYLRSANDANSDPILSISSGETVTVLERPSDSEYVHVSYNGYDGWVWNGYLS
jgi:uncharacterized protein YgiM (DUF1202 family)